VGRKGYQDLLVWQKAKDLAVLMYKISNDGELSKDFGLRDQMRRAAVSVPSNLAEGDERETDKESVRFFYMAKGSLAELRTQIQIAHEIGYLEQEVAATLHEQCIEIAGMLGNLIKARRAKGEGLKAKG
jgi:four helix bundle protein